ncbi:hypothetical protein K466DRAFT_87883 [Polyporus arcularius HHB13444]|uniref:Uncharacterized protein n=1 Tax=Polyporus arcularius HHB13444 TaxID=1314778 RepID=A0A5C3PGW2_9APHY|nr:hypothetical protein K466DRAFT_87883 [Polyporus arcularius HHB13444]
MSALSIQDRINFIRGIDIIAPHGHGVVLVHADGQDSAVVAAGSGLAFVGGLSAQSKADVINSTLFALELAADKQYDRWNNTSAWLDYYKYVLETVGYVVQSFDLAGVSNANSFLTVDNLLLKLGEVYLSGAELALFTTMVESLKQARNESAIRLFDSYSKSSNKAHFQLGVASDHTQDSTVLKLGVYRYSTEQNIDIDSVLFFKFRSQEVEFSAGNLAMVLNNSIYGDIRKEILEQLGPMAKLVKEIKL